GGAVEREIESPGQRLHLTVGGKVDTAGQLASCKGREWRQRTRLDADVAVESIFGNIAHHRQAEAVCGKQRLGKLDRVPCVPVTVNVEGNPDAKRFGDVGAGGGYAGSPACD